MKKKIRLVFGIFVFGFLLVLRTNAQSISPAIISIAGGDSTVNGITMSWTIGENLTETYVSDVNLITQGFHQTKLIITLIEDNKTFDIYINVYPNPVKEYVNIEIEKEFLPLDLSVYNMEGKNLIEKRLFNQKSEIDFNNFPIGTYFLKFLSGENEIIKTYKIQKY